MESLRTTGKATPADVRAVNRRLLLQHISEGRGSISRADLVRLAERLGYPIHLINDSDACALAEVALSDDPAPTLMALYVGDGVGAGLILSGGLFQGETFGAGEVGHLNLRTHDLRCECGRTGCL